MEASPTADLWPQRVDSMASISVSSASSSKSMRTLSAKWMPSWLSRSAASTDSSVSSRRHSSSTTKSCLSTSTASSTSTRSSAYSNSYQLHGPSPRGLSAHKETAGAFDSAANATLALASLAEGPLDLDEDSHLHDTETGIQSGIQSHGRLSTDVNPRSKSRATSTRSKAFSNPRHSPAGFAEVEMLSRDYHGYWRSSFTATIPPAAAICGTMLLTARLPAQLGSAKMTSTDPELRQQACSLQDSFDDGASPQEAMQALHGYGIEAVVIALRSSLDAAELPIVPERPAWAIYEKIAQAKNYPDKMPILWNNVSKLLHRIPSEQMVTIMFLLSVARRLQSRGVDIDGRSAAVYLLQKLWPRYVSEEASKLLMLHYDDMPLDLPLVLEAVNYRFSGRRCNLLALDASRSDTTALVESDQQGNQETYSS